MSQLDSDNEAKRVNLKTFQILHGHLWPYIRKYRGLLFLCIGLISLSTICSLVTPWLLGFTVDHVFIPKKTKLIAPMALAFFLVDILYAITVISQHYLLTSLGQKVLHDLRQDLLKKYQFYPVSEFSKTPTGRLVTRLVNDTSSLQDLFTGGIALALGNIAIVLGIIVWLIVLHPALGLVCVSVFPVMAIAAHFFGSKIREAFRNSRAALSLVNSFLAENISGMWLIQVFNKQKDFKKRFLQTSTAYTNCQIKAVQSFAYFQPTITILSSFSMALLIWYGGFQITRSHFSDDVPTTGVTLGLLVAFISYLQALYAPIRDITEKFNLLLSALSSSERIFEFMQRPEEIGTRSHIEKFARYPLKGSVEFKNVYFRYPSKSYWALRDISFSIQPGEKIGVVGHTGAGKTTLSALLLRFYETTYGQILIDGQDLTKLDKREIRQSIGYIQQEPFLFSGTVEENIFLWNDSLKNIFSSFPAFVREPFEGSNLKFSRRIFEKGSNLSAGERQIISFARALVHQPDILILDEATAHVDAFTETWVSRVSEEMFKKQTLFIIAHRLATLKSVDRILVMHHGAIAELGTHKELLEKNGLYKNLYDIQSRKEDLEGTTSVLQTHTSLNNVL